MEIHILNTQIIQYRGTITHIFQKHILHPNSIQKFTETTHYWVKKNCKESYIVVPKLLLSGVEPIFSFIIV